MKKIKKALKKLSPKERKSVEKAVEQLLSNNWHGLDIVKLQGAADIYRVRIGRVRVIFIYRKKRLNILAIERRSEKTYKRF